MVQWLRLCAPIAEGIGSIPGQGTKIPHAVGMAKKSEYFLITALIFRHNILKQPNQEPLNDTYAA